MSQLYTHTLGAGTPVLLIHGWAMHHGYWQPVAEQLAANHRVISVDLPGHGHSADIEFDLHSVTAAVANICPDNTHVIGWSLGGMIAQNLALHYPQKVARLGLTASSPCFHRRTDWHWGGRPELLKMTTQLMVNDFPQFLNTLLTLQNLGNKPTPDIREALLHYAALAPHPRRVGIHSGLQILLNDDLRAELPKIAAPTWITNGGLDKLTPPPCGEALASGIPNATLTVFDDALHAPFLTHTPQFIELALRP